MRRALDKRLRADGIEDGPQAIGAPCQRGIFGPDWERNLDKAVRFDDVAGA